MTKITTLLPTLTYLFFAPPVRAQGSFNISLEPEVSSRVAVNTDLGDFVTRVFSAVIIVGGIATFLYLAYGGVQWIMAGGDKSKVQEARDKITQAVIGIAILASAWTIFLLVDYFFGIGITE